MRGDECMVKVRFAPMSVTVTGYDFDGVEDFQTFINQMSTTYGPALGVFCVTLPLKFKKDVDLLLLKGKKKKTIKAQAERKRKRGV